MDSEATGANTMSGDLSEHKPRPGLFQREFGAPAPMPLAPKSKLKHSKEGSPSLQTIYFDSSLNDAKTDFLFSAAQKQKSVISLTSAASWNNNPYM